MARRPPDVATIAMVCADDSVAIMSLVIREYRADGSLAWSRMVDSSTVLGEIARTEKSLDPQKVPIKSWRPINVDDIPRDRTFRNALSDDGQKLYHDMVKARELHRAAIRVVRTDKLAALDVAYIRADEQGDLAEKQRIVAEKQVLRDMTEDPAIEAAKTTDELKAFWPSALNG